MNNCKYKIGDKVSYNTIINIIVDKIGLCNNEIVYYVTITTEFSSYILIKESYWIKEEKLNDLFKLISADYKYQKEQYISPFTGEII